MKGIVRGTYYLTLSQLFFWVASYGVHILAARKLGPADYGTLGILIAILTVTQLLLNDGFLRTISKLVAQNPDKEKEIFYSSLKFIITVSLPFTLLMFLVAPFLATILKDNSLTFFIRIVAVFIPFYSIRALYQGYENGKMNYPLEGGMTLFSSLSKVGVILLALVFNVGILGFLVGSYFLPPIAGFIWALFKDPVARAQFKFPWRTIFYFSFTFTVMSVIISLLTNIDLFFVKRYTDSLSTGFYTAAANFARLPLYILLGFLGALFPKISKAAENFDSESLLNYVKKSLKYSLILFLPLYILMISQSELLLTKIFGEPYKGAAPIFSVLLLASLSFIFFKILLTVSMAGKSFKNSFYLTLIIIVIDIILNFLLVPKYGTKGAALATLIVSSIGLLAMIYLIYRKESLRFLSWQYFFIIILLIPFYFLNQYAIKTLSLVNLGIVILYLALYVFVLVAFKILSESDIQTFKTLWKVARNTVR